MKQKEKTAQLSFQDTEWKYYKLLFLAEELGITLSELLRIITDKYLEEYETDRALSENDRIKASRRGPASDKQKRYVAFLCEKSGRDVPDLKKLTNEEADRLIKEIKKIIEDEAHKQEEFYLEEQEDEK